MTTAPRERIAFVGGGAMAEAMIAGLLARGLARPADLQVSAPRAERRAALERTHGVRTFAANRDAVRGASLVVLAVKPQVQGIVRRELAGRLEPGQLVVSIAAGVPLAVVAGGLGHEAVVRAMPNTPARIGRGTTVWCASPAVSAAQREAARALLGALGDEVEVATEEHVALATPVSGSGPAYLFLVMEALAEAAERAGLPRDLAVRLVASTMEGAARYAREDGRDAAALRAEVTSPGGVTAAALERLEAGGLRELFADAVRAGRERERELARRAADEQP